MAARRPRRPPSAGTALPPRPGLTQDELIAGISSIDAEISVHQDILRGAALQVYGPLVEEALGRIRAKAAELTIPAGAIPTRIKGLEIGTPVTVTMSPEEAAVVIGHRTNPDTGAPEVILLVRGKGIVVAKPEEVTPGVLSSPAPSTSEVLAPGPLPQGPETVSLVSAAGSIHAGDLVDTPLGQGRVIAEPVTEGAAYKVDVRGQDVYMFSRGELKVVPPPAPASP